MAALNLPGGGGANLAQVKRAVEPFVESASASAITATTARNDAIGAAQSVGSYTTLALANAALASIPADKGVYVTADGVNNGYYVKRSGVLVRESTATVSALDARQGLIEVVIKPGITGPAGISHFFEDTNGTVIGYVKTDGTFVFATATAKRLTADVALLSQMTAGGTTFTPEIIPGVGLAFSDPNGAVAGYIGLDGRLRWGAALFRSFKVGTIEVDKLLLGGVDVTETYPGITDADVDGLGFVSRLMRYDGVEKRRAAPVSVRGVLAPDYSRNAVAVLPPIGVSDALIGWFFPGRDAVQSAANLAIWGEAGAIVGTPDIGGRYLTTGAGYVETNIPERIAWTWLGVARLADVDAAGAIFSCRSTDPAVNETTTPFGGEIKIVPTGVGRAANVVVSATYADVPTGLSLINVSASLAIADSGAFRLLAVTVDNTGITINDLTAGTSASAAPAGQAYRFVGKKTFRIGSDPSGTLTGGSDHVQHIVLDRVITAAERAALAAFARTHHPLSGVST